MRTMIREFKKIRSWTDAAKFVWDYGVPLVVSAAVALVFYWFQDREPARRFVHDPAVGAPGFIQPNPVVAGTPAVVRWLVQRQRACDNVGLFQEIVIQTKTSAPLVIRLERIDVRSRARYRWFERPPPEWITREFFVPQSANICTRERCEPVDAEYRATLTDYCNPVHKMGFPIESESPSLKFRINPTVALPPLVHAPSSPPEERK
jgi:hypothetical protein